MRWLMCGFLLAACVAAAPPRPSNHERAAAHRRAAEEALADGTVEGRRKALAEIRAAVLLERDDPDLWLLHGRVSALSRYDAESRACFRRAMALNPASYPAHLELAMAWKREWTATLDTLAILRALGVLDSAVALQPETADAWLLLSPLRYEAFDFRGARRAASRALRCQPPRPEAAMLAACVAFREGDLESADSLFREAMPRLPDVLRSIFENAASVLGDEAGLIEWSKLDPDPTTPENDLQLEYWSRVAHAFLLFHDPLRPGIDTRMETYIRYGPPGRMALNPIGMPLYFRTFSTALAPAQGREMEEGGNPGRIPMDFPTTIQAWGYPDLGMRVVLQDRSLRGHYAAMAGADDDPSARPHPAVLAARDDLVPLGGGIAVFNRLPRIETRGLVARFAGQGASRLLTQVDVPGGPADSLSARWLVTDLDGRAIAQGAQALAISACDPGERRSAQFSADLPPGGYQVTVSVRDTQGRRGMFRSRLSLEGPASELQLSDLVLACNDPTLLVGGGSARVDANVEARVSGSRPLVGYLEIYGLATGPDGEARFDYRCDVRRPLRAGDKTRPVDAAVLVSTSREEVHVGGMRRQFITVPIQSLPPGRYVLEVRVRDHRSGATAERTALFVRD